MFGICQNLFSKLNSAGIRYVIWKGASHIEDGLNGQGDVDLLVHEEDKSGLYQIYKELYFINPETQVWIGHENVEDWLGYDEETGSLVHMHTYFKMYTGTKLVDEYEIALDEHCFEVASVYADLIKIQHPAIEYLILLSRIYTGSVKDEKKINGVWDYIKKSDSSDFKSVYEKVGFNSDEINQIMNSLAEEKCNAKALSGDIYKKILKDCLNGKAVSEEKRRRIKRKLAYANKKGIRKKLLKRNGIRLAFVGQDGAGKSTVTEDILKWINWKIETKKFYLGSGEHYVSWKKNVSKATSKSKNPLFKMISVVTSIGDKCELAKKNYKNVLEACEYAKNGGVAIFDRYPQMYYKGINDGPKIQTKYADKLKNGMMKKFILSFAAKEEKYIKATTDIAPEVLIKLLLPPEESIRRKPEESIERVTLKHNIIKDHDFGCENILIVDATMNYDEEIKLIKAYIWKYLAKRNS